MEAREALLPFKLNVKFIQYFVFNIRKFGILILLFANAGAFWYVCYLDILIITITPQDKTPHKDSVVAAAGSVGVSSYEDSVPQQSL